MAPEITIHNDSKKTIFLIPFSCHYRENPRSPFLVRKRLAKNIPAGGHKKVKLEDYSQRNLPEFQIHMLFRAEKLPDIVEAGDDEKVFPYTDLALADNAKWILKLENNQVTGGPGYAAGQTSSGANAAAPQDESPLGKLMEKVRQLTQEVKDLKKKVADLEKRLPK